MEGREEGNGREKREDQLRFGALIEQFEFVHLFKKKKNQSKNSPLTYINYKKRLGGGWPFYYIFLQGLRGGGGSYREDKFDLCNKWTVPYVFMSFSIDTLSLH